MTPKNAKLFLDYFPDHQYRYIDQSGKNRIPISSTERRDDLNVAGYEAYFTANGFKDAPNAKLENCSSLNSFFVDIDHRKDEKELEEIKKKLDPTFIIETKKGWHIYWLLDEPIFKDETFGTEWDEAIKKWEKIEASIVKELKADPSVKDVPRILRIPDSIYWKNTDGSFKIKGVYKNPANRYTMEQAEEVFPIKEEVTIYNDSKEGNALKKYSEGEKADFFKRVNEEYPIEDRDSFKALISGKEGTVLPNTRNQALLITVSLMKQADWKKREIISHFDEIGWHGMEKENGGSQEIITTINSAFSNNYTYSFKNEIIAHNMTENELQKIHGAYVEAQKQRKEVDRVRFTNYEREILSQYPYLKKNKAGIVFNYYNGVYKMLSDFDLSDIVLNSLYDDMLWNYRTKRNVSDKVACLLSIIPELELSKDGGYIMNLKNGLLNILTRKIEPHNPNFVSLIQSPVEYDPKAICPIWLECMDAWMKGDEREEKTLLLQQFTGYCLSSSMLYDRALFLVGDGGNGKSTFVDTISMVIGKEATSHIDLEGLYGQYGMKGIIGKRLNVIEEVHGNYYQSNKLKKLISGEPVTIDVKYKDQFEFIPQAKFIFAVNIMPRVDDTSSATERRICAVQFLNNFRDNPNTTLRSSAGVLAKELPGIMNWMLDGADKLREMGRFIVTNEQTNLLSEYRQENSSVEGYIAECLEFEEGAISTVRELYDDYKDYCVKDGRKFKGNIAFVKEMRAHAKKYGKFSFIERISGHDTSKFEGVKMFDEWSSKKLLDKEFNDF